MVAKCMYMVGHHPDTKHHSPGATAGAKVASAAVTHCLSPADSVRDLGGHDPYSGLPVGYRSRA